MIRFVDRLPYALVVAICAAVAPLLVMLPFATADVRPLVVVPGMGLVLGFFAAIIILWSEKSTLVGDHGRNDVSDTRGRWSRQRGDLVVVTREP